jgi:5-methylcytosine-specific restriction endonuclease McrA
VSSVFVVDQDRKPLDPIHPGRARFLLKSGHAAVLRRYPFTIIMKEPKPDAQPAPLRVKIDPGSQTSGLALVNDATGQVVWAAELTHRGQQVKEALDTRRASRHGRRQRHTRYRPPRFNNRSRPKGWLPPSLLSRLQNIVTWIARLQKIASISAISFELVRFDTQLLEHPEIVGIEYQQGTLAGWEVREYLLVKHEYRCAYCGKTATRWEVDHIQPRSRKGSDRITNLVLACHECNQKKDNLTAAEFGHPEVQVFAAKPLRDAAAVNATRWALYERLQATGLPVETGTGGRTKWNRTQRELPKAHWVDASCVGVSTPSRLQINSIVPLLITAEGCQRRRMQNVDKYGFPRGIPKSVTCVEGFRTGDIVRANVPVGRETSGTYVGRVLVRATKNFDIRTATARIPNVHAKYCQAVQRQDGYRYAAGKGVKLPPQV